MTQWIASPEKDTANAALEKRLWDAADQFRANSGLKAQEYSAPVLGLIFLRFAEVRFAAQRAKLELPSTSGKGAGGGGAAGPSRRGSRVDEPAAYHAEGILYLPAEARFDYLLNRPEAENIGAKVNAAMRDIEKHNPQLAGVLPKTYNLFTSTLLKELLKKVSEIPASLDYDAFGRIYEYFLGEFAMSEGQGGGEFYTPSSIVRLLTEVIEPYHGRILDPACGSGGMFVSSARFVSEHWRRTPSSPALLPKGEGCDGKGTPPEYSGDPARELSICGVEKTDETGRLCRLNLAVHGLEGEIKHGGNINSYYDDPHDATGRFDFVLANPPFNVNAVDKERLKDMVGPARRFPFGLPRTDNANYLWIQLFHSALNEKGRAGFVMANSASDARSSEQDIRRQLIESRAVDVMVAVGPNMFYTVTLPCTLWFMDKAKASLPPCPPSPQPSPKGRGSDAGAGEGDAQYRGGYDFSGLKKRARELRKKQTSAEELLWQLLRDRQLAGMKFRRQHQIGDYIADFFCAECGLVVELDGSVHGKPDRQKVDAKRDAYLRALGHEVLRFPNDRVFADPEGLLGDILNLSPSPSGRGARGEGAQHGRRDGDEGKQDRANTVLFIDARHIYRQVDRAHREWSPAQIGFLANLVRLYRGEALDFTLGGDESRAKLDEIFGLPSPRGRRAGDEGAGKVAYRDVAGLCKAATLKEIEAQGWSLNPGRYVGVAPGEAVSDEDFKEQLETLNEELETLNAAARKLEATIAANVAEILEA